VLRALYSGYPGLAATAPVYVSGRTFVRLQLTAVECRSAKQEGTGLNVPRVVPRPGVLRACALGHRPDAPAKSLVAYLVSTYDGNGRRLRCPRLSANPRVKARRERWPCLLSGGCNVLSLPFRSPPVADAPCTQLHWWTRNPRPGPDDEVIYMVTDRGAGILVGSVPPDRSTRATAHLPQTFAVGCTVVVTGERNRGHAFPRRPSPSGTLDSRSA